HGRDVFAPAAAHLAAGVDLGRLGPALHDPVRMPWPGCRLSGQEIIGEVIGSDRFGNLLTSVTARWLEDRGGATGVVVGDRRLGGAVSCYADGLDGVPTPIMGSSGRLEIFVRNGSARAVLGAERGTPVRVEVRRA
ncbi:MAG TPA: SAM hydroxide adenosyltransferase, partial [Gemmataceae bacterium]|nr:SAM hydroxide adenosyltransferase [Gemmataceae bacterium]